MHIFPKHIVQKDDHKQFENAIHTGIFKESKYGLWWQAHSDVQRGYLVIGLMKGKAIRVCYIRNEGI